MSKQLVRVWNVELKNGEKMRVATIEQTLRQKSMCEGCSAPCCKGVFRPVLNEEEFLSKKFKMMYAKAPDWLIKRVPRATHLATLAIDDRSCPYHNKSTNKCELWPDLPKSCLSYDCRGDDRPEIKEFCKKREKEWPVQ